MKSSRLSKAKRFLAEISERLRSDPGLPKDKPTESYWQVPTTDSVAKLQSPQLTDEADVVIIGSGITGCSVARRLLQEDNSIKITLLEARTICSGATGRNGGHIKAVPEYSYEELLPSLGKEGADEVIRFTLANAEAVIKVSDELSSELKQFSEVRKVESVNLFTDEDAYEQFRGLLKSYEQDHDSRGYLVPREELEKKYGIYNAAGAYVGPAGAGWPYRLITSLFADMVQTFKDRLRLEALTPVKAIEFDEASQLYLVNTPRGSVKTKIVVHATNGHAGHLLPGLRGALYPVRGQMTAQAPTQQFGNQGGERSWSIHYGTGFDYMTASGRSGEIFLGGGLGQAYQHGLYEVGNTQDDCNSPLALAHLSGVINSVWGKKDFQSASSHLLAAWTGVMGFTSDGLPLIGHLPQEATSRAGKGEWIAAGFNGYGMANAWLSGKYVADQLLNKDDDGILPRSYLISAKRLNQMAAEDGAMHWMTALGLD